LRVEGAVAIAEQHAHRVSLEVRDRQIGVAVAVAGSTALVGAPYEQVGSPGVFNIGAVYVFSKSEGSWSETQKLTGSDNTAPNQFGNSVALHGHTAVVSAPAASFSGFLSREGSICVFARSGWRWNERGVLTASDASPGELFGLSVSLSANGILATALRDFLGGTPPDAAYLFGPTDLGETSSAP